MGWLTKCLIGGLLLGLILVLLKSGRERKLFLSLRLKIFKHGKEVARVLLAGQ